MCNTNLVSDDQKLLLLSFNISEQSLSLLPNFLVKL